MPTGQPALSSVSRRERNTILAILLVSALLTLGVGAVTPTTTMDVFSQAPARDAVA